MNEYNFIPAAAMILEITTEDGTLIVPAVIEIGEENEMPTMEDAKAAIDEAIYEYAKMYKVAPDKIKMLTLDEAVELGFYDGE